MKKILLISIFTLTTFLGFSQRAVVLKVKNMSISDMEYKNDTLYITEGGYIYKTEIKGMGESGQDAYIHIRFSDDGGETFTSNDGKDTGKYMGIYADNEEEDSEDPDDYTWIEVQQEGTDTNIYNSDGVISEERTVIIDEDGSLSFYKNVNNTEIELQIDDGMDGIYAGSYYDDGEGDEAGSGLNISSNQFSFSYGLKSPLTGKYQSSYFVADQWRTFMMTEYEDINTLDFWESNKDFRGNHQSSEIRKNYLGVSYITQKGDKIEQLIRGKKKLYGTVQDTTGIRYTRIKSEDFKDSTLVPKYYVDDAISNIPGGGGGNQQLSIDSTSRVFTISLENGGSVSFEDTNTEYDLSNYVTITGNETITGQKTFTKNVRVENSSPNIILKPDVVPASYNSKMGLHIYDPLNWDYLFMGYDGITGKYKFEGDVSRDFELWLNKGKRFEVKSSGGILAPGLSSSTQDNILYYNTSTGNITYGAVPGGGGSSKWTDGTYGIYRSGNVGIKTSPLLTTTLYVKNDANGVWAGHFENTWSGTGNTSLGVFIRAGIDNTYSFQVQNRSNQDLFNIRGSGSIYAPKLSSSTQDNVLYYNSTTGLITYGTTPSGGGDLSNYVTLNTTQTITGQKTFTASPWIEASNPKLYLVSNSNTPEISIRSDYSTQRVSFGYNTSAGESFIWNYQNEDFKIGLNQVERFRFKKTGDMYFSELSSKPSAPPSGFGSIYVKNDKKIYFQDSTGSEYDLTATGGGGGSSKWTDDTYGISRTTGNVGIGASSTSINRFYVTASLSNNYVTRLTNTSSNGYGLLVSSATTSNRPLLSVGTGATGTTKVFEAFGDKTIEIAGYGSGSITGTVAKYLAVTSAGKVIETDAPGGGGGGDVYKVGTPVNQQVGVWTGNGTIKGTTALTFDDTNLTVTGNVTSDQNRTQSTKTNPITFNYTDGAKGRINLTSSVVELSITNVPDGSEGAIEIYQDATGNRTISAIGGATGYTNIIRMGGVREINRVANSHTTLVYWRTGNTLYYGYIYDNVED